MDHVILLDGISTLYPGEHPADPVQRDMISRAENDAEGHRLLYVAVTQAKRSLAILALTDLHPRLEAARDLAKLKGRGQASSSRGQHAVRQHDALAQGI